MRIVKEEKKSYYIVLYTDALVKFNLLTFKGEHCRNSEFSTFIELFLYDNFV